MTAVSNAILGADFLAYYHLVPVLHDSCLIDTTTGLSTVGFVKRATLFDSILRVQGVEHHVIADGPPVSERARRLSPEKLAFAIKEFQEMLSSGICRPLSSPWASPIHMARKKDGTW